MLDIRFRKEMRIVEDKAEEPNASFGSKVLIPTNSPQDKGVSEYGRTYVGGVTELTPYEWPRSSIVNSDSDSKSSNALASQDHVTALHAPYPYMGSPSPLPCADPGRSIMQHPEFNTSEGTPGSPNSNEPKNESSERRQEKRRREQASTGAGIVSGSCKLARAPADLLTQIDSSATTSDDDNGEPYGGNGGRDRFRAK